ncbi:hypothetical protein HDE_02083 [Halotydeus destructor]|nr:hypothetical protein HDE_02083 [Halotydeus destructor]
MPTYCHLFDCLSGQKKLELERRQHERKDVLVRIVSQYFPAMMMNSSDPSNCEIGGTLGNVMPLFPRSLGYNCTAIVDDLGGPDSMGNHSGMIGRFQADTADFSPILFRVPLEGDPIAFDHIVFTDKISFSTAYKRPKAPMADNDVTASFRLIENHVWFYLIFMIVLLYAVLKRQGHKNPGFVILKYFLQMTGQQTRAISSRILALAVLVGFFVIGMFYSNFMLSELVRQEKPNVLRNFFDVLRPDAEMFFSSDSQMLNELKRSNNPRMKQIVEKYEKSANKKAPMEGMEGFNEFLGKALLSNGSVALFGKNIMIQNQKIVGCAMMASAGAVDYCLWVPEDSPHEWLMAAPFNKRLDKATRLTIEKAVVQYVERGMYGDILWYQFMSIVKREIFPGKTDPVCYSPTIISEDPDIHHSLSIVNLKMLFISLFALVFLGFISLASEKYTETCRLDKRSHHLNRQIRGDPVIFGHVVFADSLSFTTSYKRPKPPVADNDLTASLLLIDFQVWICLVFLVIFIYVVLKQQGSKSPMFKIFQCFLQMTGRQTMTTSSRVLGLTMIIGCFVISMFYSNFMLSNLVRQEKPNFLQLFYDVLKPEAKIYFTPENQILSELKRSTNPKMRQIVEKVERQDLKETLLAEGMDGFSDFVRYAMQPGKRVALFGKSLMIQEQKMVGCALAASVGPASEYSLWVPSDSPQEWVVATPFNKRLDRKTREAVDEAVMHYVEQGMFGYVFWWQVMTIVRDILFQDIPVDPLCYSSTIIAENPSHHSLNMTNLKILLILYFLITIVACITMIGEKFEATRRASSRNFPTISMMTVTNSLAVRATRVSTSVRF